MYLRRKRSSVVLLLGCVFCFTPRASSQSKPVDQEAHIRRIEAQAVDLSLSPNEPPLQLSLQKLMELYKIPGFSIAVIDNYQIAWTKAYGVTDAGSNKPVTTATLFQAG